MIGKSETTANPTVADDDLGISNHKMLGWFRFAVCATPNCDGG
jgi:hypothetical protein